MLKLNSIRYVHILDFILILFLLYFYERQVY